MKSSFITKYRPKNLDDFIWPNDKAEAQIRDYLPTSSNDFGKLDPLLLYGTNGAGKTTLMKLLGKLKDPNFTGLNETIIAAKAQNNVVGFTDSLVSSITSFAFNGGLKVIGIDEADTLTTPVQEALKACMSDLESTPADALLVFTTNHIERLDPGIVSRCVQVEMSQRNPERFLPKMREIFKKEKVPIPIDSLLLPVAEQSGTDIRNLYRTLEDMVGKMRAQAQQAGSPAPTNNNPHGLTLLGKKVSV